MPLQYPAGYHDRFDADKQYEKHLFRSGKVLQGAELNEIQEEQHDRLRGVGDAIFRNGDIIRGCGIYVNKDTGEAKCDGGAIYAFGKVRGVAPATLTIPMVGYVQIGLFVVREIISEVEDPELRDPATITRNYMEPGAHRLKMTLQWGIGPGDDFILLWEVDDGIVRPKEAPPAFDAIMQALARYDRDSAGGHYIVRGLMLKQELDDEDGKQVYTLSDGAARISGYGLEFPASRRIVYDAQPDLFWVDSEPHQSTTVSAQRVDYDRWPVSGDPEVRITARKTVSMTHGGFTGVADPLPDNSVIEVEEVSQGATVYASGTSWTLTAGTIDWSPAGPEPTPGSTYTVTYKYVQVATPTLTDDRGFTVSGALVGTLILVSYHHALRRIDRLCVDRGGIISWMQGVSAQWLPKPPRIPFGRIPLASVYQTWDHRRQVRLDSTRMVPMEDLAHYRNDLNKLREDTAEIRLAVDVSGRYSGIKKGLFADPFFSNEMRDAGIPQTATVTGSSLVLPFTFEVHQLGVDITDRQYLPHSHDAVLNQNARTGTMLVNPYMAFDPLPRDVVLIPAVDRWTIVNETWSSPTTQTFFDRPTNTLTSNPNAGRLTQLDDGDWLASVDAASEIELLREIDVEFRLDFGAGETLTSVRFDGLVVIPSPLSGGSLVADSSGILRGKFRIPTGIKAGTKRVDFTGSGGSRGSTLFTGQGTLIQRELQRIIKYVEPEIYYEVTSGITNVTSSPPPPPYCDPLAQTFALTSVGQVSGVDVWIGAKGTSDLIIHIRDVENGIPTSRVFAECRLPNASLVVGQFARATWAPILLDAEKEYAFVVMCDDDVTSIGIAELGKWDLVGLNWMTSQPYQVGVLLSSSNARTWTPHQDRDLTFHLLAPTYTSTRRQIDLGTVPVTDCTDIMIQSFAEIPSGACSVTFLVTVGGRPAFEISAGQAINLQERFTGNINVQAVLRGTSTLSPILEPGVQLIAASIQTSGTYVSPMLTASDTNSIRAIFEANLPSGATVAVDYQTDGSPDWSPVPFLSSSPYPNGVIEFTHEADSIAADGIRLRLTVNGTHLARPSIHNLRAVIL